MGILYLGVPYVGVRHVYRYLYIYIYMLYPQI